MQQMFDGGEMSLMRLIMKLYLTFGQPSSPLGVNINLKFVRVHFMKKRNSSKFHFKLKTLPTKVEHLQNYLPILSLYQPLNQ